MWSVNNGSKTKEDKDEAAMYNTDEISKSKGLLEESRVQIKREEEDVVEITAEDILGHSDEETDKSTSHTTEFSSQRADNLNTKTDIEICHITSNPNEKQSCVPFENDVSIQTSEINEPESNIERINITENISAYNDVAEHIFYDSDSSAKASNLYTLRELLIKPTLLQSALNLYVNKQLTTDVLSPVPSSESHSEANIHLKISSLPINLEGSQSITGRKLPPLIPIKSSKKVQRVPKSNKKASSLSDSDFDSDFEDRSSLKKLKFDQSFLIDKLLTSENKDNAKCDSQIVPVNDSKDNSNRVINEEIFIISDSEDEEIPIQKDLNTSNKNCDTKESTADLLDNEKQATNIGLDDNQQVVVRYITENNQKQVIIENKSNYEVLLSNLNKHSEEVIDTTDIVSYSNNHINFGTHNNGTVGDSDSTKINTNDTGDNLTRRKTVYVSPEDIAGYRYKSNIENPVSNKTDQNGDKEKADNDDSDNDNLTISEEPLIEPRKKKKVVITKKLLKELQDSTQKNELYYCIIPECLFSAKSKLAIWAHMKDRHQFLVEPKGEALKCLDIVCPEIFDSSRNLMLHVIGYHSKNSTGISCVVCTYKASASTCLANHFKLHGVLMEPTHLVRCPLCRYVIVRRNKNCSYKHLIYHIKNMDESNEEARKLSEIVIAKQIEEALKNSIKQQQAYILPIIQKSDNSIKSPEKYVYIKDKQNYIRVKIPEKKNKISKRCSSEDFETSKKESNKNIMETENIQAINNKLIKRNSTEDFETSINFNKELYTYKKSINKITKEKSNKNKDVNKDTIQQNSMKTNRIIKVGSKQILKRSSTEDFQECPKVKKKGDSETIDIKDNNDVAEKLFLDNFPKLAGVSITLVEKEKK